MENRERSIKNIIEDKLTGDQLKEFNRIYYGREDHCTLKLNDEAIRKSEEDGIQLAGYSFKAANEDTRPPRVVKLGLVQHSIVLTTDNPVHSQRNAIFYKVKNLIEIAASEGVNILCLQETWAMPFFLCTGDKEAWSQFAESPTNGPSVLFLAELAKKHGMVIISPILEDDNGTWWNTAVVINEEGRILGKHRKNHLPSVGSFSETAYYSPGDLGHAVFDTKYGRIAVNICYGRHHALNWLMFGLNGAEMVFNPSATVAEFGESFWGIEARNAAVANGYFTCSINRVGTEEFTIKTEPGKSISRNFYGSSYVTAPNGCRTPSLSRVTDGILVAEVDLNLCRQVKDQWGFNMTSRLNEYAEELNQVLLQK
ncbi:beta-ureidopropionase-like [Plutella xylostella]|uniref:beta-ureidopropionase-like n=1 Tax=Plutella xylostella TaxID=51655 RepID=UPI002032F440|nr:beta-ureidopropionase-like [Plutella xylostella]